MDNTEFDPRIYGGAAPTGVAVPVIPLPTDRPTPAPVGPDLVPDFAAAASRSLVATKVAAAERDAIIYKPEPATVWESVSGAISQTAGFRLKEFWNEPASTPDPEFSSHVAMQQLDFVPSTEEDKFLRSSTSQTQWQFRREQLDQQRLVQQAVGEHPALGFVVSVFDPLYIGIDIASLGAARAARLMGAGSGAARAVGAGSAGIGALAVSLMERQVAPVSDAEIVLNALGNAGATALSYRGGSMVPKDPAYPSKAINDVAADLNRSVPTPVEAAVRAETATMGAPIRRVETFPTRRFDRDPSASYAAETRTASQALEEVIDRKVPEFGSLALELRRVGGTMLDDLPVKQIRNPGPDTRSYYHPNEHAVYTDMRNLGDVETARILVHEVSHGLTVQKILYGEMNPSTAIGKLVSELNDLRLLSIERAQKFNVMPDKSTAKYLASDTHEFVAGLFWGGSPFTAFLSSIKLDGSVNALSKMVSTVRKLLGLTSDRESVLTRALNIKEQLIAEPLNVRFPDSRVLKFSPDMTGNVAEQIVKHEESLASKVGNKISISLHKTMGSFGPKSKEVSDLLFDDPINMTGDSVASQARAISADLAAKKYAAEDLFAAVLAERGAGIRQRIGNSAGSTKVQQALEHDVSLLMAERYRLGTKAKGEDPKMAALADALDEAYKAGLLEQKAAGVRGSDTVEPKMGYFPRKMDSTRQDEMLTKLRNSGMTTAEAQKALDHMVARGIVRMNPAMSAEVAQDVAHAILARARAKGYFEDVVFRRHIGNEAAKEMREILTGSGIRGDRLDRAMAALEGAVDEAGKSSSMKHRVDMDLRYGMNIPGTSEQIRIVDLLDTSILRLTEGYLDKAAGNAAFARKGLADATAIDKLRTDLSHSIANESERKRAMYLFDNGVAMLKGDPVGEDMHIMMRNTQAVTQMVGLGSSGLWQLTETAPIMSQYGAVKTTKEILRTMPVFKQIMGELWTDKGLATHLSNVLARNASQDVRIRPYITKLEDNFDMPIGDAVGMSLLQAKQLVPYINGMKYIQRWQAGMVGNLIADTFERAAKGNKNALEALEKVGLESQTMDGIKADILAHGLDTAKWSDTTWQSVRGPLNKMVDDSILRARVGEIPAFAQFSQVGKFVFTFRNFVLTAHNKILAGTLGREGFAGLGLLMAYQYPLTLLATAVNHSVSGKSEPKTLEELAAMSLSQMGAMGLLSEFAGVISGNKQQFGAPGLIAIDRMYKAVGAVGTELRGGEGSPMAAFLQTMPILSIIPGTKALAETLKD